MGYTLEAFVAQNVVFEKHRSRDSFKSVMLPQGFALVPLTDKFHDSFPLSSEIPHPQFYKLSPALADWATELSHRGAIAYLEVEFWGGTGTHASIVWCEGRAALGPLATEVAWSDGQYVAPPIRENAVNRALRQLGVLVGDNHDEFDALALGSHRDTDEWVETIVERR